MAIHTGILLPLDTPDLFAQHFEHLLFDARGDGPYLRRGIGVAHNETGTYRPVKPRKVERYNILTLFIFNRTNDSFDQFIHK